MAVQVRIKYSTTPNGVPGMCTTVTLNTTDTSRIVSGRVCSRSLKRFALTVSALRKVID